MYLKSIKAYGFKSFADKIEISFEKNINGIVGPNGSGKSNVVDAVRWVLGEQSIKSLRGDTSTDVIFSGSKSRKALNSASVTLTFDNSDFYLPISYTEVSVKRVMYRSGENEYFLNNERCRLKDITNLLTDTGVDKESFNIISQGKIDEILSTRSVDRRRVFESAAGVLKYKKRKEEATKKLERTNLNMNRVLDIIGELENQVGPLEKQSKMAQRFLEVKKELSDLEISLLAMDIHRFHYDISVLQEQLNGFRDEIVRLSSTHSSYDVDLLTKRDALKKLELEISQEQSVLLEATRNIEKMNADVRVLKMRKSYSDGDTSREAEQLLILKEDILKVEQAYHEGKNAIAMLEEELRSQQRKCGEIQEKYFERNEEKNQSLMRIEKNHQKLNQLQYRIDYLENVLVNGGNLPNAIKNILGNKRFTGVHQIIGTLIDMDQKYRLAIATALGSAHNYLVVDTREDAKKLVHYLKENQLGRVTFFPLDTIKPRVMDTVTSSKLQKMDGFVGIASCLVRYDVVYQDIILNQLGNIIICDDLNHANEIGKSILNRYKIVTLDGQVVNVGGSITGGSTSSNHNFIQDKYELEKLKLEVQTYGEKNAILSKEVDAFSKELNDYQASLLEMRNKVSEMENQVLMKRKRQEELEQTKKSLEREKKDLEAICQNHSDQELEMMLGMYYSAIENKDNIVKELELLKSKKLKLEESIQEIEEVSKRDQYYLNQKEKSLKELELKENSMNMKLDQLLLRLGEEYNLTYEAAISKYQLKISEEEAREKVSLFKREMKEIGYVNVNAIEEYDKLKERYDFLLGQKEDLLQAENTLLGIIHEMDEVMKEKFLTTFEKVRLEFKKVFREMFHGGEAELLLTEPDNLLETGIEIQAIPTGKNLKSITLLSGGEKTFTAISLLFAILNVRAVPFCLLDEVEAALDDANVESFGHYLDQYRDKTQFILITHKKKTMEFANTLYGITMQESGVSKLVSVRLAEIENG